MKKQAAGYGVLAKDGGPKETIAEFVQEIEARLVLPSPRSSGQAVTLVTRLRADGFYEFRVENERREAVLEGTGNLLTDTETTQ